MGRFNNENPQEQFEKEAAKLSYNRIPDRTERIRLINDLIEEYIEETGERPDSRQLERLASAILYEELQGDTRPDKVTKEEHPILTLNQIKRRHSSESSSKIFDLIASDGRNYAKTHRKLTIEEEIKREELAARHPKNRRFWEARKPGEVIVYRIEDIK